MTQHVLASMLTEKLMTTAAC